MRVEIDHYGIIRTYNNESQPHSFKGKPAIINSQGEMCWYYRGVLLKVQYPNGKTTEVRSVTEAKKWLSK